MYTNIIYMRHNQATHDITLYECYIIGLHILVLLNFIQLIY